MLKMVFNKRDLDRSFASNRKRKQTLSIHDRTAKTARIAVSNPQQSKIKVILRVRPPNSKENDLNYRIVLQLVDDKMLIFDPKESNEEFFYQGTKQRSRDVSKKVNKEMNFIFDNVFGFDSSNMDVFESGTKDILGSLMEGYNCSVFVYGATGAGKTHTMLGTDENPGIMFLTMVELFERIRSLEDDRSFHLGITYVEVYNETVRNLLCPTQELHLREDAKHGVMLAGVTVTQISSAQELLSLLASGNKHRTQHPTDANAESSRSHAVFQVHIRMMTKLNGQVKQVKLSMIDLAGSERASATKCLGARFKEGANINKSLLALGNVINSLADGSKHVPYRDSKLTRLLKDSLGGNCQTVMIANVSPSSISYEDTYNTLKYAARAKHIKTNMKKNIVSCDQHIGHYIQRNKDLTARIEALTAQNGALAAQNKAQAAKLKAYESQGPPETKSSTVSKMANLPVQVLSVNEAKVAKWQERLDAYFRAKLNALEEALLLQSLEKTLVWRTSLKELAGVRLEKLATDDEELTGCRTRIFSSVTQFNKQAWGIQERLTRCWDKLAKIEADLQSALQEAEASDIASLLADYTMNKKMEIDLRVGDSKLKHITKLFGIQKHEIMATHNAALMQSEMLKQFYLFLKGYNKMTEQMDQNYHMLVKKVGGVKAITFGMDQGALDPEMVAITELSVKHPEASNIAAGGILNNIKKKEIYLESRSIDNCESSEDYNPTPRNNITITLSENEVETDSEVEMEIKTEKFPSLNDTVTLFKKPLKKSLFVLANDNKENYKADDINDLTLTSDDDVTVTKVAPVSSGAIKKLSPARIKKNILVDNVNKISKPALKSRRMFLKTNKQTPSPKRRMIMNRNLLVNKENKGSTTSNRNTAKDVLFQRPVSTRALPGPCIKTTDKKDALSFGRPNSDLRPKSTLAITSKVKSAAKL